MLSPFLKKEIICTRVDPRTGLSNELSAILKMEFVLCNVVIRQQPPVVGDCCAFEMRLISPWTDVSFYLILAYLNLNLSCHIWLVVILLMSTEL